jgi:hypothetical protein
MERRGQRKMKALRHGQKTGKLKGDRKEYKGDELEEQESKREGLE